MTVLVLAERYDATADLVVRELNRRGADTFRCDTADFPSALTISASLDGAWRGTLRGVRREVTLEEIHSVYFRRPTRFAFPETMSEPERTFAAAEARAGLGGVLMGLDCRWVNHPGRAADAEYKPVQLAAAAASGLSTPATVITNDPETVTAFLTEGGDVVYKTLSSPAVMDGDEMALVYTTDVGVSHIRPDRFALTAHLFQRRVPKGRDVRVTLVGTDAFAIAIHVDTTAAALDWRADYTAHRYETTELPGDVLDCLLALLRRLGLVFAAVDLVVTPDEEYMFVDLNPNGQWGWLQEATGAPIAAAIAHELVAGGDG